ncbi:hypothetical protein D3C71_2066700 [compost metagenome]
MKQKFAAKTRKPHKMLTENSGFRNRFNCSSGSGLRSSTHRKAANDTAATTSDRMMPVLP